VRLQRQVGLTGGLIDDVLIDVHLEPGFAALRGFGVVDLDLERVLRSCDSGDPGDQDDGGEDARVDHARHDSTAAPAPGRDQRGGESTSALGAMVADMEREQ